MRCLPLPLLAACGRTMVDPADPGPETTVLVYD
jgi:hypothetical protein